jgi:hypothetical protein
MATYRRRSITFGTEVGTEVADVCSLVVVVLPGDGVAAVVGTAALVGADVGAVECLEDPQPLTPRAVARTATRATVHLVN